MGKTAKLNIVAPGREKLTEEVISLSTSESNGNIEFLANHAPIIVATVPTVSSYTTSTGEKKRLFTSSGIVYIKDDTINFCYSFNFPDEIDVNRAEEALKRAKERLNNKEERIDIERANRALLRAKARLKLK